MVDVGRLTPEQTVALFRELWDNLPSQQRIELLDQLCDDEEKDELAELWHTE